MYTIYIDWTWTCDSSKCTIIIYSASHTYTSIQLPFSLNSPKHTLDICPLFHAHHVYVYLLFALHYNYMACLELLTSLWWRDICIKFMTQKYCRIWYLIWSYQRMIKHSVKSKYNFAPLNGFFSYEVVLSVFILNSFIHRNRTIFIKCSYSIFEWGNIKLISILNSNVYTFPKRFHRAAKRLR